MTARILDGKAVAARVRSEVAAGVQQFRASHGRVPGLAVVRVGHDPASQLYVRGKIKASAEVGMLSEEHHLPEETNTREVVAAVNQLANRDEIDGILVQLPLPKGVDQEIALSAVPAWKDVDGFDVVNLGRLVHGRRGIRACTPLGCMRLIAEAGVDLRGKRAVVAGRSVIVGKPMALLLLEADATVTVCHSRTTDLEAEVRNADVLVAAIGKPEIIPGAWIKEGAVVIDVGQNRRADGKLVGDVHFEGASERAAAITPVPGGVGPMTIAMLLENTLQAAKIRVSGAP